MSMIILFLKEIADLQSPSDSSNSLSLPQRHWRSTWDYARHYITFTWHTDCHSFQQNGGQNRAKWVWTEIEIRHKRPGIIKLVCYCCFWIVNCLKLEASLFWEWPGNEFQEAEEDDDDEEDEDDDDDDEEEGSEEDEDEVEPKLKYERIGNAMNTILNGEECASCMAVHTKVRSQSSTRPC